MPRLVICRALYWHQTQSRPAHNLEALLNFADTRGFQSQLELTDKHREEIFNANAYYAGKALEYPAVGEALMGHPGLPNLDVLFDAANLLVIGLEQTCQGA